LDRPCRIVRHGGGTSGENAYDLFRDTARHRIDDNKDEFLELGTLPLVGAPLETGNGAVMVVEDYWLDERYSRFQSPQN
jgi:hypothetical protein